MRKYDGILKTAFAPLCSRAAQGDSFAMFIVDTMRANRNKYPGVPLHKSPEVRVEQRTNLIDAAVKEYLTSRADVDLVTCVANLGAGLCTRYQRIGCFVDAWHNYDLVPMIDLRNSFISEAFNERHFGYDLLKNHYQGTGPEKPECYDLVVAEGFIDYIPLARAKELLNRHCIISAQGLRRVVPLGPDQVWRFDPKDWDHMEILNMWDFDTYTNGRHAVVVEMRPK